jgi:aminotransferase
MQAPSTIEEISLLATQVKALDLAMGTPVDPLPGFVSDYFSRSQNNDIHQYADPNGLLTLRQQIAGEYGQRFDLNVDPQHHCTLVSGATQGMMIALMSVLNKGDEVIVFEPFFPPYASQIALAGGIVKAVPLTMGDWQIDFAALQGSITDKTKLIILNSPHNPTGRVFSASEYAQLGQVCLDHDLMCIEDRVYQDYVFTEAEAPLFAAVPGMQDRTIICNSFSKRFLITGWRIGYVIHPQRLSEKLRAIHTNFQCSLPSPLVHCLSHHYADFVGAHDAVKRSFMNRKKRVIEIVQALGVSIDSSQGGWFFMASTDSLFTDTIDSDIAMALLNNHRVATVPGSLFMSNNADINKVRISFCKAENYLKDFQDDKKLTKLKEAIYV